VYVFVEYSLLCDPLLMLYIGICLCPWSASESTVQIIHINRSAECIENGLARRSNGPILHGSRACVIPATTDRRPSSLGMDQWRGHPSSATRDRTATGSIVADMKSLACNFSSISFVHVTRSANEVAHMLIRSGEQSDYLVLCHCISGCIQEIGYSDLLTEWIEPTLT